MIRSLILMLAVVAGAVPLIEMTPRYKIVDAAPRWPSQFEGRAITPIAPSAEDRELARGFPGRLQRFSDGRRQIVLRTITAPTRRLHQARDCFKAIGSTISPAPMRVSPDGKAASCFIAKRGGKTLKICEQIRGPQGKSWPDVSSWYWSAVLGSSTAPWMASMTVEALTKG
jgi:hypothetical protein